jgi:RNA-directed DNA polymerase
MGKATGKNGWKLKQSKMSKTTDAESSISERPISLGPRRLAEWLNPTGTKKVHSLVDKVYKMKNLQLAWEKVKQNDGSGGIDKQSIKEFEKSVQSNLQKLHEELKTNKSLSEK